MCVCVTVAVCVQSKNVDLAQRCREFEALLAKPSLMVDVLPVDASCEDIEVRPLFLCVCVLLARWCVCVFACASVPVLSM